jgi:site-specific recombinase XerD
MGDLSLAAGRAIVRGSKPGHDRAIYLTPALIEALQRFLPHRPDLPGEDHVFLLHRRLPCAWTIRDRLTKYARHATPSAPHLCHAIDQSRSVYPVAAPIDGASLH